MTLSLWRSYSKARNNVFACGNSHHSLYSLYTFLTRSFSDEKFTNPEFVNSTILIENGFNVHELPVVIKKLKDLEELEVVPASEAPRATSDSLSYHLIQEEFRQCTDLREVFSLITKCTKITPNIALGAIERIYDLEKGTSQQFSNSQTVHINFAKGAILEKLLKVVMKTEDTQTILNVLQTSSSIMEPYRYKFCDELFFRVIDNKLTIGQLCDFAKFLITNNKNQKYSETIDRLWVGFINREKEINEKNILQMFKILPGLKISKKTVTNLLEQKLSELWCKINVPDMQDILDMFIIEKYFSMQSFTVLGHWFYNNIHAFDDDTLLDIITKFTRLKYTDDQIEAAIKKFLKLKMSKIRSHVLLVGVLNYCMQFNLRNEQILQICSKYFLTNRKDVPSSFLKSFIYPFGYLYVQPNSSKFWESIEDLIIENIYKINVNDMCSIILSHIYSGTYPLKLVSKIFSAEYVTQVNNSETLRKLHLIDTALSIECKDYVGPLLPKDQWFKPVVQDIRIRNIIEKIKDIIISVVGDSNKVSTAVFLPNYCSDETYLIDIMLHPAGLGSTTFNWKPKIVKNDNLALLIHLPDHYCSDNNQLIGPQIMKRRQLKLLGLKVVSLKYSTISQLYTSHDNVALKKYLLDCIENAKPSI